MVEWLILEELRGAPEQGYAVVTALGRRGPGVARSSICGSPRRVETRAGAEMLHIRRLEVRNSAPR